MSDSVPSPVAAIESPPPTPAPAREAAPDPRQQLLRLADELIRSNNRRLLAEYLRLRRTLR